MTHLVIVANRLPVELDEAGTVSASPGGLASALSSVTAPGTHWVGWAGPKSVGMHPSARRPFEQHGVTLHPVHLTAGEVERHYAGMSNSVLWPLFHGRLRSIEIDRGCWRTYRAVNERFAARVADVAPLGATVWVHDYQLMLVPSLLRARRRDLRIGFFLHIPFPGAQLFAVLPWRRELISGLLGADLIGFQTEDDVTNFFASADRVAGASAAGHALTDRLRSVSVGAFPISVDFAEWEASGRAAEARAADLRATLGVEHVFLGIDRLDYTKGIVPRLRAFAELLDEGRLRADEATFVQVAPPSRSDVAAYQEERDEVAALVEETNVRHRRADGSGPILHIDTPLDHDGMAAWYRAADVLVVTSLADGMNLVAKEFVAARPDLGGALVLSEFAGAAADLDTALIVNPYDIDDVKRALLAAATMPPAERAARLETMREHVRTHDVRRWARSFLGRMRAVHRHRGFDQAVRPPAGLPRASALAELS